MGLLLYAGGAAEGVLSEGDVIVSIDGVGCTGSVLTPLLDPKRPKHSVGLIRRKGSVPLSRGARAAACKAEVSHGAQKGAW